jgi:hypothetical protein
MHYAITDSGGFSPNVVQRRPRRFTCSAPRARRRLRRLRAGDKIARSAP